MSLYGAVVDGRRIRQPSLAHELVVDAQTITFTGSGTATFTEMAAIDEVVVSLNADTTPGLNTSVLTYSVAGNVVTVYGWAPTSNANPTLVAGTNAVTVTVVAFGRRRYGQNT